MIDSFYLFYFYFLVVVHIIVLILLIKGFKQDSILSCISIFFSLFFCSLGFWELFVTSACVTITDLNIPFSISLDYYFLGFYGFQCFSLYVISFLFYLYHLKHINKIQKFRIIGFFFLLYAIQTLSGLIGDFSFFILKGLSYFNAEYAIWLIWENNIPMGYVFQFGLGLFLVLISYLCFYVNRKIVIKT